MKYTIESKSAFGLAEPSAMARCTKGSTMVVRNCLRFSAIALAMLGSLPRRDERLELHGLDVVEWTLGATRFDHRLGDGPSLEASRDRVLLDLAQDRLHQELVLRRETAVHRAARQARGLHDVHDPGAEVALRREDLRGGVEQLRAQRVVVGVRAGVVAGPVPAGVPHEPRGYAAPAQVCA